MQMDIHYLRPRLRRFALAPNTNSLEALLDEVVAAGVDRATEPALLDSSLLDRILTSETNDG
jgi:hypothetical protein